MKQSITTMEKLDKNEMDDPEKWIQSHILNAKKDQVWRMQYLQKVGVQIVEKKESQNSIFQLNFIARTNNDVRNNYIQKLIDNRLMKQQKKHQTLTIFDWDDTLLPTTYLGQFGFVDLPLDVQESLLSVNDSASKLLLKASSVGDVFIITNAAQGWVEYSSKLYMNKVFQVIFDKKVTVVSARAGYEEMFPGDCGKWKMEAFKDISSKYENDIFTNLICLGDSNIEIDAAHTLAKEFNAALIKTIKFRECPKPEELVKQQDLMTDRFDFIYTQFKNLTIRLEKKQSQP